MPLDLAARERLRDQQQIEARRLAAVLAAQRRLAAERQKASMVIAKAEEGVAERQAAMDAAVLELIDTSGVAKASILLDRPESELARLRRTRARGEDPDEESKDRRPDVPA